MTDTAALVTQLYRAFNSRDAERLLTLVTDDVDWPDGAARMHGKAALASYWSQLWSRKHVHDEAGDPTVLRDGRIAVDIRQTVRTPEGAPVSTARFVHLFRLCGDLVARLDIEPEGQPR